MNPLPSISIVTPSFNQARYIGETIESVANQNYASLDHWIIDGASTDETAQVVEKYRALPHLRFLSASDCGQSDAINKGMRLARGDVAAWLNSDDLLYPGALRAIGETFAASVTTGLVYGAGSRVDSDGAILKEIPLRAFDRDRLRSAFYILQPSMFFRRELFLSVGGLDETRNYAMDWELLLRFPADTQVQAIPAKIGKLRCYPDTKTSAGGWKRMREIAEIGRQFNGPLDRNYLSLRARELLNRIRSKRVRDLADRMMNSCYGRENYMVQGWPEEI